jgi:hypothetical protein
MTEYTEKILSEKKKTERALEEVKKLKGLFPICSQCKKSEMIRGTGIK